MDLGAGAQEKAYLRIRVRGGRSAGLLLLLLLLGRVRRLVRRVQPTRPEALRRWARSRGNGGGGGATG